MKKEAVFTCILWGLALLLLFAVSPAANAENLYDSVIRIHVLANSDSPEDQETKLFVRDRLLAYAQKHLTAKSLREAKEEVTAKIPEMEREAETCLREQGVEMPVSITLTEEYYPTRVYDTLSLPAGRYLSLRVLIGKAEGQNWWCILFPPLCLSSSAKAEDALAEVGMEEENVKTVVQDGTRYELRFRILELLEETKEKIRRLFS